MSYENPDNSYYDHLDDYEANQERLMDRIYEKVLEDEKRRESNQEMETEQELQAAEAHKRHIANKKEKEDAEHASYKEFIDLKNEFHEYQRLINKYNINYGIPTVIFTSNYQNEDLKNILFTIDKGEELSEDQLDSIKRDILLTPLIAHYYQKLAINSKNDKLKKWDYVKACGSWRTFSKFSRGDYVNYDKEINGIILAQKDENSKKGYDLVKNLSSEDDKLMSAILTTKTSAFLDFNRKSYKSIEDDVLTAVKLDKNFRSLKLRARFESLNGQQEKSYKTYNEAVKLEKEYENSKSSVEK